MLHWTETLRVCGRGGTDCGDKFTAEAVAEFVLDGLTLERVPFEVYRSQVVNSPGFMDCPHGQMELPGMDVAEGPGTDLKGAGESR